MLGVGPSNPIRPSPPLVWPAARSAPPMPLRRSRGRLSNRTLSIKSAPAEATRAALRRHRGSLGVLNLSAASAGNASAPLFAVGGSTAHTWRVFAVGFGGVARGYAFCSSSSPQARQHPQLRRAMKRRCAMRHDGLKRLAMLSPSRAVASRGLRRWLSSSSPRVLDSSAANAGEASALPARHSDRALDRALAVDGGCVGRICSCGPSSSPRNALFPTHRRLVAAGGALAVDGAGACRSCSCGSSSPLSAALCSRLVGGDCYRCQPAARC